jgi:hypothetical protein
MDPSNKAEVYRGRKPRELPFWQLFDNHFDEFEYRYDDLFSREYGFLRPVISIGSDSPSLERAFFRKPEKSDYLSLSPHPHPITSPPEPFYCTGGCVRQAADRFQLKSDRVKG